MLTREENEWNFKAMKIYSALNLLPVEIDGRTGKIRKQPNKIRVFLWRIFLSLGMIHCFYLVGRLVQSTILRPKNSGNLDFRWDHVIIHAVVALVFSILCYTGFCLFVGNPIECVIIFNELFVEPENPVQNTIVDEELQMQREFGDRGENSQVWIQLEPMPVSVSVSVPAQKKKAGLGIRENPESESESKSGSGARLRPRPLLTWPPQYSLDELLAKYFGLVVEGTKVFSLAIFAADPSRPQLLYSSLPPEYQNLYSFFGLFLVEAILVTVIFSSGSFSITCQLLFFGKCQVQLKRLELQLRNLKEKFQRRSHLTMNRDIGREMWILRQILKEMKELEMFIELFNRSFPPCIFALKLLCLSVSTLCYFFTIRHFQDFPVLAFFTGYVAVAYTLLYGILYQKAFSIPEKMELLKNEFLVAAHKSTPKPTSNSRSDDANRTFRAEMKREIWGIRDVGVKVGSFHTLERESTPIFINFVVNQVVSLLVTFPR